MVTDGPSGSLLCPKLGTYPGVFGIVWRDSKLPYTHVYLWSTQEYSGVLHARLQLFSRSDFHLLLSLTCSYAIHASLFISVSLFLSLYGPCCCSPIKHFSDGVSLKHIPRRIYTGNEIAQRWYAFTQKLVDSKSTDIQANSIWGCLFDTTSMATFTQQQNTVVNPVFESLNWFHSHTIKLFMGVTT